ncbi:MAG: POTRA domain-containing protein [Ginsengibacter sp.]
MKSAEHLSIVAGKLVLVLFLSCLYLFSFTQKNDIIIEDPVLPQVNSGIKAPGWLNLRNIVITGNKKTKDYIIKREMGILPGDSVLISTLTDRLKKIRQYIYNTTLFVTVKVEPILLNAFEFDIIVTVKERFYIFPLPQFQLVDRSFDEWLVKYKGSFSRVNYGIKFVHYNVSGRKDQFRLNLINGYTRNISASYNAPYSNAKLTEGFYVDAGFSQSKEIAYKTNYDNSFGYFKNDGFVRDYWYINGGYTIRKAIKKMQTISVGYSHTQVSDTIISNNFNPHYFNNNTPSQGFIDFAYTVKYTDVNNILYPLEGISGFISLQKRGFGLTGGINMFSIEGQYNKFIDLGKKWYTSMQFAGKIKLPFEQPFINQRALGDRNTFLRGLEYYTIDGVAFSTAKFNLKREILNFTIPTFFKSKTYNKIPFKFYAKAFTDFGYVYSKEKPATRLNNKLLSTAGVGVDILTLYDIHIRFDYSLNQLGKKQLAVNNRSGF